MTTLEQEAPPKPEAPYRGIESFRYIDQRIFSSRDEETWDLLSNILIYRGVLLYGDSGSGKSSLVNAGLLPAAANEHLVAHRLRIQPWQGREIKLERISTESDGRPPYLPSIFVAEGSARDKDPNVEMSLTAFYESLTTFRKEPSDRSRPLLIFDQFEEFITLFEQALHGGETLEAKNAQRDVPAVQQAILDTLTQLIEDENLPIKLLFVFREEYLAKLNLLFQSCPELLNQYVRLLPPRVEMAAEIIRAPFVDEDLKTRFTGEGNGRREIPDSLADSVAVQLQQRSESGFINLSELQIVCRKLWESPDPVGFFQGKGEDIQKVVEDYWADVLEKLGNLYDVAIALLGHMVTSSNTRNIVSEPDLKYHEKDNFEPAQIDSALDALVERKLIRREPRYKIYFYEIASEFLVPWIQQKKSDRLAQIEAAKLAAETELKLIQAEKKRRNLLFGAGVLGLLLVAAVGLAIYAFYMKTAADAARAELKTEKDKFENIVSLLNQLTGGDKQQRVDAVNKLADLKRNGQLPPKLVETIVAVVSNDSDKEVSQAGSYFFDSLIKESETASYNSDLTASILKSAEEKNADLTKTQKTTQLAPRVYIQIANKEQRARAERIAGALRSIGFTVPGYEEVGERAPKRNQLRYYQSVDDAESASTTENLDKALQKIKATDGPNWTTVRLQPSRSVRPGHFEIWFAGTPPPDEFATLTLSYQDEQGNKLSVTGATVTLDDNPFTRQIIVKSNSVSLRPGPYILHVQVPGYPVYRSEIKVQAPGLNHVVKLRKSYR